MHIYNLISNCVDSVVHLGLVVCLLEQGTVSIASEIGSKDFVLTMALQAHMAESTPSK